MVERERGSIIKGGTYVGRSIGVFTSGGDSPGMNAAIRAVVRTGLYLGCRVYFIKEGFQGMVDGGEHITEATWISVSSILPVGGTTIGTSRCMDFMERSGRLKACEHLVQKNITNLVAIGGEGSLTGVDLFKQEWASLCEELFNHAAITAEQRDKNTSLQVVGLLATIDNDFVGTDMTIGADTALHRITDALDNIAVTSKSHKRSVIMEIMGRHCGYLTLLAALSSGAEYLFIPEDPVPIDWPSKLTKNIGDSLAIGHRMSTILIAEGAIDVNGQPIKPQEVQKVLEEHLKLEVRITVLGHVQRGGSPSAFDRILASRMGAEAVIALMEAAEGKKSCIISLDGTELVRIPMVESVERTKAVAEAMNNKEFELVLKLRGKSFSRNLKTYKLLSRLKPPDIKDGGFTFAVVHIGNPACGMNAAVRAFVRTALHHGTVYGIHNGIEGLVSGDFKKFDWMDVAGWVNRGGAILGTKRSQIGDRIASIAERLEQNQIHALVIIGGFEAFLAGLKIAEAKPEYPALQIPVVVVPSTISNNVPGTEVSIGSDTAINEIAKICDRVRLSAQGTKRRVFILETMGGYCGYLPVLGGLAGGADDVYIYEEKFGIKDMQEDVCEMVAKMNKGVERGLILTSENASRNYDADFFQKLYAEEGRGILSARKNIIGHMQQGEKPSPFDRNLANKMASKTVEWMVKYLQEHTTPDGKIDAVGNDSSVCLGIEGRQYRFTPLVDMKKRSKIDLRIPADHWWLKLKSLVRILAR